MTDFCQLFLLHVFLAIPVVHFVAGREPDVIVLRDIFKRSFQMLELVRLTDMEGVQADRHTPRVRRAFFVQDIELIDDHVAECFRRDPEVQERLVALLETGETCLQAIDMLSHISDRAWRVELTKELCLVLNTFAKKRDELRLCPGPLLFCVLTIEFLMRLASISLQHQNRCLSTAEVFKELGISIEDSFKDEKELRYLFQQQDSLRRATIYNMQLW